MVALRWGRSEAVAGGLIAGLSLAVLGPAAYAWLAGVALAFGSVAVSAGVAGEGTRDRGRWTVIAGLMGGLALVVRPDLIVAVAGAHAALIWQRSARDRLVLLCAMSIGASPLLLHAIVAGPADVFAGLVIEPLQTQTSARRLPIPGVDSEAGLLFALVVGATASMVAWGCFSIARNRGQTALVTLALGLFAGGMLPQMFQRAEILHVLYVGCVVLPFAPIALGAAGRMVHRTIGDALVAASCALVVALILVAADRSFALGIVPSYTIEVGGRSFPLFVEEDERDLRLFLDAVERAAKPGERLLVAPEELRRTNYNDTYLYYLLDQLTPATYFLEMNPDAAARRDGRLAEDIRSADVLILTDQYDMWNEPNASSEFGSNELNEVVAGEFCRVTKRAHWTFLRKC